MQTFKWIQISDLHFGDGAEYSKKCREQLLQHIGKMCDRHPVDCVIITGDIIFAKGLDKKQRTAEYSTAQQYIKDLYKAVWKEEYDKERFSKRVFIVPGNHDIMRGDPRKASAEKLLDSKSSTYYESGIIKTDYLDETTTALAQYLTFYKKLVLPEIGTKARKEFHYIVETDKVNILHINTCLASSADGDDGRLIIGIDLLIKALKGINNSKPTIAIAHHNFDCLNRTEQRKLEVLLKEKKIFLYLCGHAHERESSFVFSAKQTQVLNTFTCGTLLHGHSGTQYNNVVFYRGELDMGSSSGNVYAFSWNLQSDWHEDKEFGLAQNINDNFRSFNSVYTIDSHPTDRLSSSGVYSKIVSHQSAARSNAFLQLNEQATESLSIYGIGLSSVSKRDQLLNRILDNGGTIKFCMVDPSIFKTTNNGSCISLLTSPGMCGLESTNFCIYASHIDDYIRKEYYDDIRKSVKRIAEYKKSRINKPGTFLVRAIKSFIPMSINIINENDEGAAIVEYNMPFTSNRLLIQLSQKEEPGHFNNIKETFNTIWERAEDISWAFDEQLKIDQL